MEEKEEKDNTNSIYDVIIVGGGISGLVTARQCLKNGLQNVIVLEKRAGLGGLWNFSSDPSLVTVCEGTECTSSQHITEVTDFAMSSDMDEWPTGQQFCSYIKRYSAHFQLDPIIQYLTRVDQCVYDPVQSLWTVSITRKTTIDDESLSQPMHLQTRFLAVCAGLSSEMKDIPTKYRALNGVSVIHANQLKTKAMLAHFLELDGLATLENEQKKGKVLIIGGGETASNIVERLVAMTKNKSDNEMGIVWSIRNGQSFFRKCGLWFHAVLDEATSCIIQDISPFIHPHLPKTGARWLCNLFSTGSPFAYNGHGIAQWKHQRTKTWHNLMNKEGRSLRHIYSGRVSAKPDVLRIDSKHRAHFMDNTSSTNISKIILCIGYRNNLHAFLPRAYDRPNCNCFQFTFSTSKPGPVLAYMGYARPVAGSLTASAEISATLAAKYWSGKIPLPSTEVMVDISDSDARFWRKYFGFGTESDSQSESHPPIYCPFTYIHGAFMWMYPPFGLDFCQIFSRFGFRIWMRAYFSPWNSAQLVLCEALWMHVRACKANSADMKKEASALAEVATHHMWKRRTFRNLYWPLLLIVFRFLQMDVWCDSIASLKYGWQLAKAKANTITQNLYLPLSDHAL